MEIKDKKGKVIDTVFNITKEGEKALEELGLNQNLVKNIERRDEDGKNNK